MNHKKESDQTTITRVELQGHELLDEELSEVTGGANINTHIQRHVHTGDCITKPIISGTAPGDRLRTIKNGLNGADLFANTYCGCKEPSNCIWSCLRRDEVERTGRLCNDCQVLKACPW